MARVKMLTVTKVEIYSEKRPHWSNHLLTPEQFHQQDKLPVITWSTKREK